VRALPGTAFRFGEFSVDPADRLLLRNGREIPLRPKAFDTLACLVERGGHLVTKDELLDRVWPGTHVSEAVLTHCVAEVRQALGDHPHHPRYLKTVSGRGYKLLVPVEPAEIQTAEAPPVAEPASLASPPAIAVLPFVNMSPDAGNEFFCDGISEELINGLTRLERLHVVAHTSSFAFKGREVDVRDIGARLNVSSVLEGSVRKSGDRLRISAQLVDARSGYHLWAEQYDCALEDVFTVQEEIARAIVRALRIELLGFAARPLVKPSTSNPDAHELYLRGRFYWHRRYSGFMQRAMECFERAVAADPAFAPAYTGLADCAGSLGVWGFVPPRAVFPRARELADRALALDESLAEAHASRAFVRLFHEWDWDGAERGLRRAIVLNPGCALTHLWLGHHLSIVGRMVEAIAEVTRARDLDPLSPVVHANVGWTYLLAGDLPCAFDALNRAVAVDPLNAMAYFYLGAAHGTAGNFTEAVAMQQKALDVAPEFPGAREALGCARAGSGECDLAREILRETEARRRTGYVSGFSLGLLYAALGEVDAAFDVLAHALEERDALLPWLKYMRTPAAVTLRADARFPPLLAGLGLD
jgi:TolB-like protein/Flp pilus assembly protein TadD